MDGSLINLDGLSKPASILVKKICNAVGVIYQPHQIVRVAKAEAQAKLIQAEADIQVEEMHSRAVARFIRDEAIKQSNIESIVCKAIPKLVASAKPDEIDNDWLMLFFDKSKLFSDEEMQELWAKVLAGEANEPGAFSRRTITFISTMSKKDAELFTKLCSFAVNIERTETLIIVLDLEVKDNIYHHAGLGFQEFSHLDDIGLITYNNITGFTIKPKLATNELPFSYFGNNYYFKYLKPNKTIIEIGSVILTRTGEELVKISGAQRNDGYIEYLIQRFIVHNKGVQIARA